MDVVLIQFQASVLIVIANKKFTSKTTIREKILVSDTELRKK